MILARKSTTILLYSKQYLWKINHKEHKVGTKNTKEVPMKILKVMNVNVFLCVLCVFLWVL